MKNRILPPCITEGGVWDEARRKELLEIFSHEVYGVMPTGEHQTTWKVEYEKEIEGLGYKSVVMLTVATPKGPYSFPLYLYIPKEAGKTHSVPVALYVGNRPRHAQKVTIPPDLNMTDLSELMGAEAMSVLGGMQANGNKENMQDNAPQPCDLEHAEELDNWPVADLLRRGYATAAYYTEDLEPDRVTDMTEGIICYYDDVKTRGSERWGAIAAWAFGASRAIDFLSTDERLNKNQIAIIGHSRGGKTALWCAANDQRVACCYANNSGSTGAALSRGKKGEQIFHINTFFPFWFCENYKAYNKKEESLPIDQHMLLALIAPRPLYLASATEDLWADPQSEFLSAVNASQVYETLGLPGLEISEFPEPGVPSYNGTIGYHVREGGHALTRDDWMKFCDFWERHR